MSIYYSRGKSTGTEAVSWIFQKKVNGSTVYTYNRSISYVASSFTGEGIIDYHKRKARGDLLPHTNFSQVEIEHNLNPSTYTQQRPGSEEILTGYSCAYETGRYPNLAHLGSPDTSRLQALVQQAAANVYQKGWDAGTFLGELPSLGRMFKGVAKRVHDLARNKHGYRTGKELQKLWLEGRYGWRTLAYDIRDLNSAITEWDSKRLIWTARSGYGYQESLEDIDVLTYSDTDLTVATTVTTDWSLRGSVAAALRPARFQVDPLITGWELVPYSFVIDWVYDVGTALAARRLLATAQGVTASQGYVAETRYKWSVTSGTPKAPYTYVNYSENSDCMIRTTLRTPSGISLQPTVAGRDWSPDLALDLQALARVKTRF